MSTRRPSPSRRGPRGAGARGGTRPEQRAERAGGRRPSSPQNAASNSKARDGQQSRGDTPSRRATGGRPKNTENTRQRFRMKRSVVVSGARGSRRISLRLAVVLFFAVLAVIIVTPTLSNYLERQAELRDAKAELESVRQHNEDLERELQLWQDDDYVRAQARERLGYVMPGQTLYVVTDPNEGTARERLDERVETANRQRRAATPWFVTLWDSVTMAGEVSGDDVDNPNNTPLIEPVEPTESEAGSTPSETVATQSSDGSAADGGE
ncbi:septum formation initiator family protein [Actinobaculum sp. 352]|uniref:FtsB family cell division protein n=1 Tax=Actinobaculum sp. 352 TaxID=2490946 RepID=UPI001F49530A|nr:septum formation initiator family protein [Actinobaculum sp. 352]